MILGIAAIIAGGIIAELTLNKLQKKGYKFLKMDNMVIAAYEVENNHLYLNQIDMAYTENEVVTLIEGLENQKFDLVSYLNIDANEF